MGDIITTRDNSAVKYAAKIAKSRSFRLQEGLFCAEGLRLCKEIAKSTKPVKIFYTAKAAQQNPEITDLCDDNSEVMEHVAQKIATTQNTQGVFALFKTEYKTIDQVKQGKNYVVLENVQNPSNAGAIIRSAAAFGFSGVILTNSCCDIYSDKALRASMGAIGRVDIILHEDIESAVNALKEKNIKTYATTLENAKSINDVSYSENENVGIIFGNEAGGLSAEAKNVADEAVYIPMAQTAESLNVAVAAGVFLWHFRKGGIL